MKDKSKTTKQDAKGASEPRVQRRVIRSFSQRFFDEGVCKTLPAIERLDLFLRKLQMWIGVRPATKLREVINESIADALRKHIAEQAGTTPLRYEELSAAFDFIRTKVPRKGTPTKPGAYWFRLRSSSSWRIQEVFQSEKLGGLAVQLGNEGQILVSCMEREWFGPLEKPDN